MNNYGNEQKINNYINNNFSNTVINKSNSENKKLQNKCDYLFNSYDVLKIILFPNLTEEKNKFMDMLINLIKSQIKLFIDIINLNDSNIIYEKINLNNQNLSKQITDIYNSNNLLLSSYEINQKANNINSIFNNNNQKYNSFGGDNDNYKIGDSNNIRNKLEQINTKIRDSPIKIEIKESNNNYIPIGLSTPISPYTFKSNKKNNFVNLHTNNSNINNNKNVKKVRSYSALKKFNPNKSNKNNVNINNLYFTEKIKRNNKSNIKNNSLFFSNSLSNLYKKERKNDFFQNIYSNNNYKLNKRNKKCIQNIKKYQNIESEVALYLKRENDFNKRKNSLLYNTKLSHSNKKNKQNSNSDNEEESKDLYQLLPNSLKQTLDDFIKKKQEYIFDEVYDKK